MPNLPQFVRPTYEDALKAWKKLLGERGFSTDLLWIFDENLCFEKQPAGEKDFKLSIQTSITPPPPDADRVAFNYFCDFAARLVFYHLGSLRGKSVCLMLCDEWFESKEEKDGFIRHDEWLVSYYPGKADEVDEIADEARWKQRILKERPLHDLDFCMTLRAVHEILAHGRALTPYEHYALKLLHAWSHTPVQNQ